MYRVDKFSEGISIDIGLSCNNNCVFCVQEKNNPKAFFNLSTREVKSMIKEVRHFCNGIIINGGEPTIRKDIIELISYAKSLGFRAIMMISNGRMFAYSDFCERLYNAGLGLVFITLQSSTAELHDAMTKVKGSFKQTIKGINNLKKCGIEVCTNTVINKLNYKDLPRLAYLLSELNINFAKLSFIRIRGSASDNINFIVPKMNEVVASVRLAADNFIKLNRDFVIQEIPPCIMKTHLRYIKKGSKMPYIDNRLLNAGEFFKKYAREGNIKLTQCSKCIYDDECLGPWEEYVNYFTDKEFKPIIK